MKRIFTAALAALAAAALVAAPAAAAPGGEPGSPIVPDFIYADGELYGTILQGPLHYNGNPRSFDKLFLVPGQAPVSEAAPGNRDYNGGRWLPTPVTWNVAAYPITSYSQLHAAAMNGDVTIGTPITEAAFLCPLIPNH